jgi:cell division protein ZapB
MDAELVRLEQQIEQLIARYEGLKEENRSLRLRAAELEGANHALAAKVRDAVARVESLLQKLPEG